MTNLKEDDREMLIITGDLIQSLRNRLLDPNQAGQCREELERMLGIKETLFWRADAGSSCVGRAMSAHLFAEVQLLEAVLLHLPDVDEGVPQAARVAFHSVSIITREGLPRPTTQRAAATRRPPRGTGTRRPGGAGSLQLRRSTSSGARSPALRAGRYAARHAISSVAEPAAITSPARMRTGIDCR